ncbi:LacI family DNA-binding transcriptional regulator [Streptomyces shenzhenensis]|uniref:LacI family DNA-binding transcriptional regulator n=1 Tax=Streptomyces shenzhenensis TaxID=943815 RepID=UPI003D91874C
MASIRDVARLAQVSTATVVRVLNGGATVSPARTERVMKAVAELDYVTNGVAASLSRGSTRLLGLLVSDIANPFTAQVARGLEDEAVRHGYQVLIASSDFDREREAAMLASFARRTVDAVALLSADGATESVSRLVRSGMPTVFVDRRPRTRRPSRSCARTPSRPPARPSAT